MNNQEHSKGRSQAEEVETQPSGGTSELPSTDTNASDNASDPNFPTAVERDRNQGTSVSHRRLRRRPTRRNRLHYEIVPPAQPAKTGQSKSFVRIHPRVVPTDFAELEDGSLVDLVEDPGDPTNTKLIVCKQGESRLADQVEDRGRVLVPLPRKDAILRRVRLPRGAKPYNSVDSLLREIRTMIDRCVALPEPHPGVLPYFVLSTWLVDRLPLAPYVSLTGLPQSGKTTLLKVLSLLCRRSLLTADITSAAFYQACAQLTPTLLIDETGTGGNSRLLHHLLRIGTTRDVIAMRKSQSFHAYGAKVICWPEPPDDPALNSRCIQIPMIEVNKPDLLKPTDPGLEESGAELQKALLQFRFDNYKRVQLPKIPGAEALRPRVRDLLACLAAPCADNKSCCESLLGYFEYHNIVTKEPLSPPQNAVLLGLFWAAHLQMEREILRLGDLTFVVNRVLKEHGEHFQLQARKVGAVMTSLGFTGRLRTKMGYTVCLDRKDRRRAHELVKSYGLDSQSSLSLKTSNKDCPICREFGFEKEDQSKAKK